MIRPTQGRIVWYHVGERWPAMIVKVHDDRRVDVKVFTSDNIFTDHGVLLRQPDDPEPKQPHAEWMDYQVGQAAKTEDVVEALAEDIEAVKKTVDQFIAKVEQRFANLFGR